MPWDILNPGGGEIYMYIYIYYIGIILSPKFPQDFQLDAITRDGDVVNRKGGFEGGYRDERVSKIGAVMKVISF
jgi:hypothetical protein